MIWATAKSTDVSRRQMPWPRRANGLGAARREEAAEIAAGVAMTIP